MSAHPNSVPDWVILSKQLWIHRLHLYASPVELYPKTSHGIYDVEKDASLWQSLMMRYQADVRLQDDYGDTCWSALLEMCCVYNKNHLENPVVKELFEARVKGLLKMHADPCIATAEGLTPTIQAFTAGDRIYGADLEAGALIGPSWISALAASNVDVTVVARHSFRECRANYELLGMLNYWHILRNVRLPPSAKYQDLHYECQRWHYECQRLHYECQRLCNERQGLLFNDVGDLEDFLLDAFEECGIYPDESWWVEEGELSEWDTSATAVDFIPQTMYNADQQDMEVKRRKGRSLEEE